MDTKLDCEVPVDVEGTVDMTMWRREQVGIDHRSGRSVADEAATGRCRPRVVVNARATGTRQTIAVDVMCWCKCGFSHFEYSTVLKSGESSRPPSPKPELCALILSPPPLFSASQNANRHSRFVCTAGRRNNPTSRRCPVPLVPGASRARHLTSQIAKAHCKGLSLTILAHV